MKRLFTTLIGMLLALSAAAQPEAGGLKIIQSPDYHVDGHGLATKYTAEKLGIDAETVRRIAYFSQAPDDLFMSYSAVAVGVWGFFGQWGYRHNIVSTLHSLHGGDSDGVKTRRERLSELISKMDLRRREDHWKIGFLIHAYGDSYAHVHDTPAGEHAFGPLVGHLFSTDHTDTISAHPARFEAYARQLCEALSAAARKPSACRPVAAKEFLEAISLENYKFSDKLRNELRPELNKAAVEQFLTQVQTYLEAASNAVVSPPRVNVAPQP